MVGTIKLNTKNLVNIHPDVSVPTYDRGGIQTGIVHVGVGGFHRAHQALYTDDLMQKHGVTNWGICGVALLDVDRKIYEVLKKQEGLYTLMYTNADGSLTARVIGSITEMLFAPDDPEAVIEKMASEQTRIITLTITEGGYNFDQTTGEFLPETPSVLHDIKTPLQPKTIFGYLTQAIKRRKDRKASGFTIQSCDNIQQNGDVAKEMLLEYVRLAEPSLVDWIERHVAFPNSMVDRITPVTALSDIEKLREVYNIDDEWPVICEPFYQWVIEDKFSNGRPEWDKAGAQFVVDVHPYEKMKIGLVNGGHTALAFSGYIHGYRYVCDVASDTVYAKFLKDFIDNEVIPTLDDVPGIDLSAYKETLVERFENPHIKDQLTRVFSESSAKIPKFLLPTIKEQLILNGPIKCAAVMLAAWCRYLELAGTPGYDYEIQDEIRDVLQQKARESVDGDPLAFLKIESIFGDLVQSARFVNTYIPIINGVRTVGIREVISRLEEY